MAEKEAAEEAELRALRQNMRVSARPVPASVYKASFDVQRSTKPRKCNYKLVLYNSMF